MPTAAALFVWRPVVRGYPRPDPRPSRMHAPQGLWRMGHDIAAYTVIMPDVGRRGKVAMVAWQGNRVNVGEADDRAVYCRCEERSDAAIPTRVRTGWGIASLRSQ